MKISVESNSLDVLSLTSFRPFIFFLLLRAMTSFIPSRTKVTKWYLSSSVLFIFRVFIHSSFIIHSVSILSHVFRRLFHLNVHFHLVWFPKSRFINFCLRGVLSSRASPSVFFFQGVNHRIGFLVTCPSHESPHTFCNSCIQHGQVYLYPYLSHQIARSSMIVESRFCYVSCEVE